MKIGSIPKPPMDPFLFDDVRSMGVEAEKLKRRFANMATPASIRDSVFEDYPHLEISLDSNGLGATVRHFGTTIRFDCLVALSKDNGVFGRVVCTLQHELWGPAEKMLLGAFAFDDRGMTDLPGDERGRPTVLPNDADRIIGYFLHRAHTANATVHVPKMDVSTA